VVRTQNSHLNFEYKILCQPNLSPPTNQSATKSLLSTKDKTREKKCIEFTSFLPKNSNQNPEEASENDFDNKNKDNYSKEGFTAATKKEKKKPKVDIKFPKVPTLLCIGDLIILEVFFCLSVCFCEKLSS
jgi:hypothetical protein